MKKYCYLFLLPLSSLFAACGEENNVFLPGSLKVMHSAVEVPDLHVNYFGEDIVFGTNPSISFGEYIRLTLPSNIQRDILFVSTQDTLTQVHQEVVELQPGEIYTLFLVGSGNNLEGLLVQDEPLILTDSLWGVRVVNLSPDSGPVSIEITGQDNPLSNDLAFKTFSDFNALSANAATGAFTFEFKDGNGEVLTDINIDPLTNGLVFKNTTLALTGKTEDGSLSVRRIDSFE